MKLVNAINTYNCPSFVDLLPVQVELPYWLVDCIPLNYLSYYRKKHSRCFRFWRSPSLSSTHSFLPMLNAPFWHNFLYYYRTCLRGWRLAWDYSNSLRLEPILFWHRQKTVNHAHHKRLWSRVIHCSMIGLCSWIFTGPQCPKSAAWRTCLQHKMIFVIEWK